MALGKADALKNCIKSTAFAKTDLMDFRRAIQELERGNMPIKSLKFDDIFLTLEKSLWSQ